MHEEARTKLNCRPYRAQVRGPGFTFFMFSRQAEERAGDAGWKSMKQAVSQMTAAESGAKKAVTKIDAYTSNGREEKNKKKGASV